jgi:hypothetical protein
LAPFHARLAYKFAKKANMSPKNVFFFFKRFSHGYKKMQNLPVSSTARGSGQKRGTRRTSSMSGEQ